MDKIRCQFCHKYIDSAAYPAHHERHLKSRPDGQQTDYSTLPPEERYQGSLDGVPRVYVHQRCGAATGMPEEIIRTYLKKPDFYSGNQTFCTGCGYHVPFEVCVWEATGEKLQTYFDRLRAEKQQELLRLGAAGRARARKWRAEQPKEPPGLFERIMAKLARLFG